MSENKKLIKVSSTTSVPQLSGSIVHSVDEDSNVNVELRAIGASAVNQMYKGIASARGILAQRGKDLYIIPGFDTVTEGEQSKTALIARLVIK